ncbi:hypothetical protein GC197_16785 [bacterium]|nr:hypothetical protein [bacterium]
MFPPFNRPGAGSWRCSLIALAAAIGTLTAADIASADRLILRDLTLINNVTVIGFDDEGVKVTDHDLIPWHVIELGTVSPDKQADFDRLRKEVGVPLFRIHQRLKVGDYPGALEPAEALFERYRNRDSKVAYMVCQAVMWGRLANGQREAALEPYFCCLRCLKANRADLASLPGSRQLDYDKQTGLTSDLLPLFFDHKLATESLPKAAAMAGKLGADLPNGVYVYMAALAITAEKYVDAENWIGRIKTGNLVVKEWPDILNANLSIETGDLDGARTQLQPLVNTLQPENQPVARYLLGIAGTRSQGFLMIENGILDLLYVPALYGNEYPELTAAALLETHTALLRVQQTAQATEIRQQLLLYYGGTQHANQLRAESKTPGKP